jgi:hypothetical protein
MFNATASTAQNTAIQLSNADGVLSYTGGGASGSYIWGAQFENGTFLSPYLSNTSNVAYTSASMLDQMKYNLKNTGSFSGSYFGGWTSGYGGNKPDGATGYMDTNLNASTQLTNGNFHLSFYTRTNSTKGTNSNEILLNKSYGKSTRKSD